MKGTWKGTKRVERTFFPSFADDAKIARRSKKSCWHHNQLLPLVCKQELEEGEFRARKFPHSITTTTRKILLWIPFWKAAAAVLLNAWKNVYHDSYVKVLFFSCFWKELYYLSTRRASWADVAVVMRLRNQFVLAASYWLWERSDLYHVTKFPAIGKFENKTSSLASFSEFLGQFDTLTRTLNFRVHFLKVKKGCSCVKRCVSKGTTAWNSVRVRFSLNYWPATWYKVKAASSMHLFG